MTLNGYFMTNLVFVPAVFSVVVLEESPCPRGSSRTNFQVLVLVLVLVLGSSSLGNFPGLSRLSVSALCAGVAMTKLVYGWYSVFPEDAGMYLRPGVYSVVVLEESPCPRGPIFKSSLLLLVLVLRHQVLVLVLKA